MNQPISPLDALALAQLRALLDTARESARSRASIARLVGLVLLDAVNERVTHFAAMSLPGVEVKARDEFEALVSKVKAALGQRWRSDAWADVRKLHRARNAAQHEGIQSDPEAIPGWITATERYTRTLVDAAFGVTLDEVSLADAVTSSDLRERLRSSEQGLHRGDPAQCIKEAVDAFYTASNRWMVQHQRPSVSPPRRWTDPLAEIEKSINQVERRLATQAFAIDPGEHTWFREVAGAQLETVTLDEARRALSYVFWWIIRWEAATASLVHDRIGQWQERQRRVRTTNRPAWVISGRTTGRIQNDLYEVMFDIADVPPKNEYGEWSRAVHTKRLRLERHAATNIFMMPTGQLRCLVPDTVDIESFIDDIDAILKEADVEVLAEIAKTVEATRIREQRRASFVEEVATIRHLFPEWVTDVHPPEFDRRPGNCIRLAVSFDQHLTQRVIQVFREHPGVQHCYISTNGTIGLEPVVSVADLADLLQSIDEKISTILREANERADKINAASAALTRKIDSALAVRVTRDESRQG